MIDAVSAEVALHRHGGSKTESDVETAAGLDSTGSGLSSGLFPDCGASCHCSVLAPTHRYSVTTHSSAQPSALLHSPPQRPTGLIRLVPTAVQPVTYSLTAVLIVSTPLLGANDPALSALNRLTISAFRLAMAAHWWQCGRRGHSPLTQSLTHSLTRV